MVDIQLYNLMFVILLYLNFFVKERLYILNINCYLEIFCIDNKGCRYIFGAKQKVK